MDDPTTRLLIEALGGDPDGQAYEHSFTPGPVSLEQLAEAGADLKAGAAMRLLIEALPEEYRQRAREHMEALTVAILTPDAEHPGYGIEIQIPDGIYEGASIYESGTGSTLAEAADKCREALEATFGVGTTA